MTATTTCPITVLAIVGNVLDAIRERGADEFGNPLQPLDADGGEPLRCCLRRADAGESIALISYSPYVRPSPWAEDGDDVASAADRMLDRPDVVEVHVRTAVPQCFLYAVRRA